ncbi:MAG: IS3 family transposase [Acidimicrobiales bacterium]
MSRYRLVSTMKAEGFAVTAACEVAEVSTSAYYDWMANVAAGPSESEWDEALVVNEMHDVHTHHDDTYGSPRMTTELRRRGYWLNHKRTERLMAENGIVAQDGRRRKLRTTIPDVSAPPLPDLVRRDFSIGEPGRRTCGDITYSAQVPVMCSRCLRALWSRGPAGSGAAHSQSPSRKARSWSGGRNRAGRRCGSLRRLSVASLVARSASKYWWVTAGLEWPSQRAIRPDRCPTPASGLRSYTGSCAARRVGRSQMDTTAAR